MSMHVLQSQGFQNWLRQNVNPNRPINLVQLSARAPIAYRPTIERIRRERTLLRFFTLTLLPSLFARRFLLPVTLPAVFITPLITLRISRRRQSLELLLVFLLLQRFFFRRL